MVGEVSPIPLQQYDITVYVIGPDSNNTPSITNTAIVPTFSYNNTTHYWECSTMILSTDITNEVFSISANDFRTYNLQGSDIVNGQSYNITLPPSHLYGWVTTGYTPTVTHYTSTPNPTTSSFLYTNTGTLLTTNSSIYSGIGGTYRTAIQTPIINATSNTIVINCTGSSAASGGSGR